MSDEANPFASPQSAAVERPEIVWANEQPDALRKVKLGLTLVYIGICGILLACIGLPILMFSFDGPDNIVPLTFVMVGAILLLSLLMFIGEVFCLAVPAESGAKTLIYAAVGLQGLGFLCSLLVAVIPDTMVTAVISVVSNLGGIASLICFILFLRRVALYIERPDIAARAVRSLIVGAVSVGLFIALTLLAIVNPQLGASFGIVILVAAIGMLVSLLMYANTVTYLRKAITV